eukprot:1152171-Pelagomonas_calceolata.AAC.8
MHKVQAPIISKADLTRTASHLSSTTIVILEQFNSDLLRELCFLYGHSPNDRVPIARPPQRGTTKGSRAPACM